MNTERPVDEEPKYKRSRYCDNLKKRRRRNDPNRKYAEQYSIERKNLKKIIWREDLAQPEGDRLTKLTNWAESEVWQLLVEFRFYGLTSAPFINPLFIPTHKESY